MKKIQKPTSPVLSIALGGLAATLGFIVLSLGTRFPFLADDYSWQRIALSHPKLDVTSFYTFSRMPVSTALATFTLRHHFLDLAPKLFIIFFFTLHAIAVSTLLYKTLDASKKVKIEKSNFLTWIGVCVLIALQPNNYEIHLWHLLSIHAVGALWIAISFQFEFKKIGPRFFLSILGATLGVLTYETFGLLWMGLLGLAWVLTLENSTYKKTEFLRGPFRLQIFSLAGIILLTVAIKLGLKTYTGYLQVIGPQEGASPWHPWNSIQNILKTLGLIHFYKTNWISTVLEWIAIAWTAIAVIRERIFSTRNTTLLLTLPWISAVPLALLPYSAQRAFYGPQILKSLILGLLLFSWISFSKLKKTRVWMIPAFLLGIAYLIQWEIIFDIKRKNFAILEQAEKQIISLMQNCQAPCVLSVPPPVPGLSKDQILPEFVWGEFYERLHLKYFPNKPIQFQINRGLKSYDSLPSQ